MSDRMWIVAKIIAVPVGANAFSGQPCGEE